MLLNWEKILKNPFFFPFRRGNSLNILCCYPQQNGIVERKNNHLLEVARGLMFQSKVPTSYWGECILTATHLINMFPSRVLKGNTPHEVLYTQERAYESLRCFGCL